MNRGPFKLTTWNCRSGSIASRLNEIAALCPDLVFLQECQPRPPLPLTPICMRLVNEQKGIAIASMTERFTLMPVEPRNGASAGCLVARVEGDELFHLLGIWGQREGGYVEDVQKSLSVYRDLFDQGPAVVLGDFNSGVPMSDPQSTARAHHSLMSFVENELNLISAYHYFHGLAHGNERHATYFHQCKVTAPWHIDFCFVPRAWADRIDDVHVGDFELWQSHSDHRPVTVSIAALNAPKVS